jgi:nicotinate-nucleotide pyrophosphorylase (carboxylating)
MIPPSLQQVRELLEASLREDLGDGDRTSEALVPQSAVARGAYTAKEPLVVGGLAIAGALVQLYDPALDFHALVSDGDRVGRGTPLAEVEGNARSILAVERTSLNFLQRLCGIASLTRRYVEAIEGTGSVIVDTRKTIPGHRLLDKYGVLCGGGENHRIGLFDAVLIKNNHLEFCDDPAKAVESARRQARALQLEVEVRDMAELESAIEAKPDVIMLDNFTPEETVKAVRFNAGRVVLESSGGITLDNVRAYAEAGVDRISVGAITHSAPASDIHLRVSPVS